MTYIRKLLTAFLRLWVCAEMQRFRSKKCIIITFQCFRRCLPLIIPNKIIRQLIDAKLQFTDNGAVFGISYGIIREKDVYLIVLF